MSHYLQRLALSAIQPGGNIHPMVGSVFAPGREGKGVAAPGIEETVSVAEVQAPRATSGEEAQAITPLLHETATEREIPSPWEARARQGGHREEALLPEQPRNSTGLGADSAPSLVMAPAKPAGGEEDDGNATDAPGHGFEALLPFAAALQNSTRNAALLPPAKGKAGAGQRWGKSPGMEVTKGEAEEIRIHIGRIEVTAVHPPAQQVSTPRAARPGPSLDEYLRRRDRGET